MCPQVCTDQKHRLSTLLTRIQGGDHSAEEELCQLLYPGLCLLAQRRTNAQEAEDIAQQALLVVLKAARAGKIEAPDGVGVFARGVVYNLCCKEVKCLQRARLDGHGDDLAAFPSSHSTPEQSAVKAQILSIAITVLAELNPQQREMLRLFYLEEQTAEQICDEMGLTPSQFRLAKSRAKTRFSRLGGDYLTSRSARLNSNPWPFRVARYA
jgi:RNA polymerase sigma factor (sigma-70 family)